jgi:hypothetical protein
MREGPPPCGPSRLRARPKPMQDFRHAIPSGMPLEVAPTESSPDDWHEDEAQERWERERSRVSSQELEALVRASWAGLNAEQRASLRRVAGALGPTRGYMYGPRVPPPRSATRHARPIRAHAPRRPRGRSTRTRSPSRSDDPHEPDLAPRSTPVPAGTISLLSRRFSRRADRPNQRSAR